MNHQKFLNIVAMMWNEEIEGSPMYGLFSKLRRLKEELRRLKKNHFEPFFLPKNPTNDRIGLDPIHWQMKRLSFNTRKFLRLSLRIMK